MKKLAFYLLILRLGLSFSLQALPINIEVNPYNIGMINANQTINSITNGSNSATTSSSDKSSNDNLAKFLNTDSNRVFGTHSDYSVEFPDFTNWRIFRDLPPGNNDIDAAYQNIHILFNARRPTLDDSRQMLTKMKYNTKRLFPDIQFSHSDTVEIDGLNFLHIYEAHVEPSNNEKYATSAYFYSGPEGSFCILGICPANTFSISKETFDQVAKKWKRGPKMIAENKILAQKLKSSDKLFDVDSGEVATPERIESSDGMFSIEEPDNIKWKFQKNEYQLRLEGCDINFSVTSSRLSYDNAEDVLAIIDNSFRSRSEIFKPSNPESVTIDGFKWIAVNYNTRINSLPLSGIYYVFTCNKGTFTMTGSTGTNLIQEKKKIIEEMAQSFSFAPSLKADLVPPKPRKTPKTYMPSKMKDKSTLPDISLVAA